MNAPSLINIPMPAELAKEMETQAGRFGMDLPTFLAFLARVQVNAIDPDFSGAVKFLLTKYPNTLRELAK